MSTLNFLKQTKGLRIRTFKSKPSRISIYINLFTACRYHGSNVAFPVHALCFMSRILPKPYRYPLIPEYLLDIPSLTTETRISPSRRSNILLIWATSFEHGKNTVDAIWRHRRHCRFLVTAPSLIYLLQIYWQHLPLLQSSGSSPDYTDLQRFPYFYRRPTHQEHHFHLFYHY